MIVEKVSTGKQYSMTKEAYDKLNGRGTRYKIISEESELVDVVKEFKGKIPSVVQEAINKPKTKTKTKSNGQRVNKTTNKGFQQNRAGNK